MLRILSFRVAMVASVILFVGATAVVVTAQLVNTGRHDDPFASLAVLMPGQPLSGIGNKYVYICDPYSPTMSRNSSCHVTSLLTGFTRLTFFVHDGIIDRLNIEDSNVTVGEMAARWGTNYGIQRLGNVNYIRWDRGQYATVTADVPFRYFLPIETLSFTQASLP